MLDRGGPNYSSGFPMLVKCRDNKQTRKECQRLFRRRERLGGLHLSVAKSLSALRNMPVPHHNGGDRQFNRRSGCFRGARIHSKAIQNGMSRKDGRRNPLVLLERALAWNTQHDRSDDALRRAGPGKRCDRKLESDLCRPVCPSRVRGACGPHGGNRRNRTTAFSDVVR